VTQSFHLLRDTSINPAKVQIHTQSNLCQGIMQGLVLVLQIEKALHQ
jgi:hypothetical protein